MKRAAAVLLALGMLTTIAAAAEAGPIINIGSISGGTGVLHAPGTLADGLNVYLGAVSITGDLGTFDGYCVDLLHYDRPGANQVTVGSMSDWNNTASPPHEGLGGQAASWLYNQYAAGAVGHQSEQAALSLAIWNSLYDNDTDVMGGGGFWATTNATYATRANEMLLALSLTKDPLPNNMWLQTQNTTGTYYAQDFMGPTPVPEPATALLLGTGLAFVAGFGRRRTRRGNSV